MYSSIVGGGYGLDIFELLSGIGWSVYMRKQHCIIREKSFHNLFGSCIPLIIGSSRITRNASSFSCSPTRLDAPLYCAKIQISSLTDRTTAYIRKNGGAGGGAIHTFGPPIVPHAQSIIHGRPSASLETAECRRALPRGCLRHTRSRPYLLRILPCSRGSPVNNKPELIR